MTPITDEEALRRLNERYFQAIDLKDLAGAGACFADDAACDYLGGVWRLSGRQAIVDALSVVNDWGNTVHAPATMRFLIGDDSAQGVVLALANLPLTDANGASYLSLRGLRYVDRYERLAGEWLIVERRQDPLWQCEFPTVSPQLPGETPRDSST